MQIETAPFRTNDSLPEVRSALRKIQEQAQLLVADQPDRITQDRMLLVIALARFCLASLPDRSRG